MSLISDHPRPTSTTVPTDKPVVLVVDDERLNLEMLRSILKRGGYEPILASSGVEALEILQHTTPALVLLDVVMEPLNGFDVLHQIRLTHRDTELPVLMVTGDSDRKTVIRAFREGANDYLTKPIDSELTLSRVSLQIRLRRAQAELERSQERYRLAAEGARIGLWDWEVTQRELFLSTRWKEMLGFGDDELVADIDSWLDRIHLSDRAQFQGLLKRRNPHERERFECEMRMLHRDESYRWMQCTGVIQSDENGDPHRLAGSLADITEGKVRDALTGLPNRLLFDERLERVAKGTHGRSGFCTVLFLDLDKFKLVNDSLGHDAGDLVLCSVARRLERCLREVGRLADGEAETCIARRGGDEFTILIEQLPSRDSAESIARRIIAALSEPISLGTQEVSIGVSIGIAFLDPANASPTETIREADTAMYYAKTEGRGCCRIYDPRMQTAATARLKLETDVRNALNGEQFFVHYQPIVSLKSGKIDGFEALSRWRHPRGEMMGPDVFVPVLESLGLIGQLGEYVLGIAGRQIIEWNQKLTRQKPLTVTVNCSTREFVQTQFQRKLLHQIAELNLDPRLIRLEVTESTLMENPAAARQCISELRASGVGVGLDDFGTGYSSLSYLHRLPLDLLKIDKSFVHSMQHGNESYIIVRNIVALAQGLNLDIVAEGVETLEQHEMLTLLGCTHAQGYFYFKPQSAEMIEELFLSAPQHPTHPHKQALVAPAKLSDGEFETLLNGIEPADSLGLTDG